jgi:hypothetical protein
MARVIPEIALVPSPQSEEARILLGHKWAPPEVGHRHQLGGSPQWLQAEEWPECCGSRMTFYAQLDSIGDEVHLADCGLIYVFVCFDCFSTESVFQCA